MTYKRKMTLLVIAVLLAAVVTGILYDIIMTAAEKGDYRREYSDAIETASDKYGVPEYIVYAVVKVESDFDASAQVEDIAYGLMQITRETFTDMTGIPEPAEELMLDAERNIDVGVHYLSYLYSMFGNWDNVFAAYNAGPGNVLKWLEDPAYSKDGETLSDIPFAETKNYVRLVNSAKNAYLRLYY